MKNNSVVVGVRMPVDLKNKISVLASSEKRKTSDWIRLLLEWAVTNRKGKRGAP